MHMLGGIELCMDSFHITMFPSLLLDTEELFKKDMKETSKHGKIYAKYEGIPNTCGLQNYKILHLHEGLTEGWQKRNKQLPGMPIPSASQDLSSQTL